MSRLISQIIACVFFLLGTFVCVAYSQGDSSLLGNPLGGIGEQHQKATQQVQEMEEGPLKQKQEMEAEYLQKKQEITDKAMSPQREMENKTEELDKEKQKNMDNLHKEQSGLEQKLFLK
jgi:hypothetical protein